MWRSAWLVWIIIVVCLTTTPWSSFQGHFHPILRSIPFGDQPLSLPDIIGNVLLFVPFGFLYVRSHPKPRGAILVAVVLLSFALSAGVELFQSFTHGRIPSATDICTNVIGGVAGAALALVCLRRKKSI